MIATSLFVVPLVVKTHGAVKWMRTCSIVGVGIFVATPNAKLFSWNDATLFTLSVASNTFVYSCMAAVSAGRCEGVLRAESTADYSYNTRTPLRMAARRMFRQQSI